MFCVHGKLCMHSLMSLPVVLKDYYDYYGPEYLLHLPVPNQPNFNSKEHLETIRNRILENLSRLQHAPGKSCIPFVFSIPFVFPYYLVVLSTSCVYYVFVGVEFAHIPPDFFCASSHDPDDLVQLGIDCEGGGRAQGEYEIGYKNDNPKLSNSRKVRITSTLQYSRPKTDRYIHKIRSSENANEFYDLNPATDPEMRLAESLVNVEQGVPQNDDVTKPQYNQDW